MKLTEHLAAERRAHAEGRLRGNLMAWLTTVRADGQPVSVPVWFLLREDETILVYSQADKAKLRNIEHNPHVALGLDVTDIGRDIVRVHGTARLADDVAPAHQNPDYVVKYAERIGTLFGTAEDFAAIYSAAVLITPTRLWA
jgi:PPOX class probable F420-dependent enzyme